VAEVAGGSGFATFEVEGVEVEDLGANADREEGKEAIDAATLVPRARSSHHLASPHRRLASPHRPRMAQEERFAMAAATAAHIVHAEADDSRLQVRRRGGGGGG
jgi:hypothetical protein